LKEWSNIISTQNCRNTEMKLFPGTRLHNNEMLHLLKVVVMPKLNFSRPPPSRYDFKRADTTYPER
jgi:hypothetical protein